MKHCSFGQRTAKFEQKIEFQFQLFAFSLLMQPQSFGRWLSLGSEWDYRVGLQSGITKRPKAISKTGTFIHNTKQTGGLLPPLDLILSIFSLFHRRQLIISVGSEATSWQICWQAKKNFF